MRRLASIVGVRVPTRAALERELSRGLPKLKHARLGAPAALILAALRFPPPSQSRRAASEVANFDFSRWTHRVIHRDESVTSQWSLH